MHAQGIVADSPARPIGDTVVHAAYEPPFHCSMGTSPQGITLSSEISLIANSVHQFTQSMLRFAGADISASCAGNMSSTG